MYVIVWQIMCLHTQGCLKAKAFSNGRPKSVRPGASISQKMSCLKMKIKFLPVLPMLHLADILLEHSRL